MKRQGERKQGETFKQCQTTETARKFVMRAKEQMKKKSK